MVLKWYVWNYLQILDINDKHLNILKIVYHKIKKYISSPKKVFLFNDIMFEKYKFSIVRKYETIMTNILTFWKYFAQNKKDDSHFFLQKKSFFNDIMFEKYKFSIIRKYETIMINILTFWKYFATK